MEAEARELQLQPKDHQTPEAGEKPGRTYPQSPPEGAEGDDHSGGGRI